MQDRIPKYPGRVALVPVTGADNIYDMVRADEPIEAGDPLSKATFLKDATATALGFSNPKTALPDDAFRVLNATYGTCGTAAGTVAKVVVCPKFILKSGARVAVRFSATNTANNPTLNVNGTGAISIARYGTTAPFPYMWQAGSVVEFFYDGTRWIMTGGTTATTTYYGPTILYDGIDSTSTTMAATANAVKKAVTQVEAAIIDKASGTTTLTAKDTIYIGDIVNIQGNYATKDLRFSANNITVQKDMSLGIILSSSKAVRKLSGINVQLQTIGTLNVSNGSTFTLSTPESAPTSTAITHIYPIDETSFLAFEAIGGTGSPNAFAYAYLSGSTLYSFSSAFNSYGSYFVAGEYLPVPGKKALIGFVDSSISKLTVNTSTSTITHTAMYPYWRLYSDPQVFFLCVLPDETLVICTESEGSAKQNSRRIRILDPNTNTSAGGPRGSAKIVASSEDLRANSSLPSHSWMTSIAVSTTTFLTVFSDHYATFTTRSGASLTSEEPFKLFNETVTDNNQIRLKHLDDYSALLITTDTHNVTRYRIIDQYKSISEPTIIQPPEPADGNPYTSWDLISGKGHIFLDLHQQINSVYKTSIAKLTKSSYAKDAIALSSASAGGNVKVCMEGNMALSSAKRGQYIKSADGETVAYSYTNGMINVIPPWNRISRDFPRGVIITWSGSIVDIPIGWAICDGQNGTPDLRDKFVLGAGGAKQPGANSAGNTGQIRTDTEGIASSVIGGINYRQFVTAVYAEADSVPYYALAYIMKVR